MNVRIKSAKLGGRVTPPASKSQAHRYLICAALADATTDIEIHGICSDIEATAECLAAIGTGVERTEHGYRITPVRDVVSDGLLKCRDSGSTLRFLLPVTAALGADVSFYMEGKLHERPLTPLDAEMERHGTCLTKDGRHLRVKGKMSGNSYRIAANVSSQFISGILMALPLLGGGDITLEGKSESVGYINMTLDAMRVFGVDVRVNGNVLTVPNSVYRSPGKLTVEGDWSGAAFWICAGALSNQGITCDSVNTESIQGDRKIIDVIKLMGAAPEIDGMSITVHSSRLCGVSVDATDIPDLVPVISATAAGACGITEITGAARLRIKECDRLAAMNEVLTSLGADVTEYSDGLTIKGTGRLIGGVVSAHNDHRIAMSAAVASMLCDGDVVIKGAECVSKSYPAFWEDFASLGGVIQIEDN